MSIRAVALNVVVLATAVALTACGSSGSADDDQPAAVSGEFGPADSSTSLDLRDIAFSVEAITASSGSVLAIDLENTGQLEHDFTIDELPAGVSAAGSDHSREAAVYVRLDRKESVRLFLRLDRPGEFFFYCSVPGHRGAGMKGVLIVE